MRYKPTYLGLLTYAQSVIVQSRNFSAPLLLSKILACSKSWYSVAVTYVPEAMILQ